MLIIEWSIAKIDIHLANICIAYMTSETEHEANLFVVLKGDILSRNSSKYLSAPLHLTGFSQINQIYLCRC